MTTTATDEAQSPPPTEPVTDADLDAVRVALPEAQAPETGPLILPE